jgi:DNA-directed RNA polymerase subunit RPC12/RpoP
MIRLPHSGRWRVRSDGAITLEEWRETSGDEEVTGGVLCANCGHRWTHTAQVGTRRIACPECSLHTGLWVNTLVRDDRHEACNCGHDVFRITLKGIYCILCGDWFMYYPDDSKLDEDDEG